MSSLLNRWKLNQDLGISNEVESTDGEFSKGVSRAWENTKATTKAAIGAMGAEDFLIAADFNQREAGRYAPKVEGFTDIRSLSDAGDWLAGTAGESVVNLGTLAVGGGVGGLAARGATRLLGGAALREAAKVGATAGIVGTSYPQQFGENIQAVRAEHGGALPEGSVPTMALTAVAQTALDTLPVMGVLGKLGLADKARGDILQKTLTSPTRIRQIGRDLGGTALKEGVTEAAQEAMKLGALEWVDSNKDHFGVEQMKQLVDSFAAGAVGGAMMGAPVAGLNALHSDKPWFRQKEAMKAEAIKRFEESGDAEQFAVDKESIKSFVEHQLALPAPTMIGDSAGNIVNPADLTPGWVQQTRSELTGLQKVLETGVPDYAKAGLMKRIATLEGDLQGYDDPAILSAPRYVNAKTLGIDPNEGLDAPVEQGRTINLVGGYLKNKPEARVEPKPILKPMRLSDIGFDSNAGLETQTTDNPSIDFMQYARQVRPVDLAKLGYDSDAGLIDPAPEAGNNIDLMRNVRQQRPINLQQLGYEADAGLRDLGTREAIPLNYPNYEQNTNAQKPLESTEIGQGIPEPRVSDAAILSNLPINNVPPPSSPPSFTPTHELADGTPVVAHPEDAGVWVAQDGGEYEGNATAINTPATPDLIKHQKLIDKYQADTAKIDIASSQAALSPLNELPEPTPAQKEAGNYKKGMVHLHGLPIAIEIPKGGERKGVDQKGKAWSTKMMAHYGYVRGSKGFDGDPVDVFMGDDAANPNLPVFVVDQVKPDGSFDEHKVMMGYSSLEAAKQGYLANYKSGWTGLGAITPMSLDKFKDLVKSGWIKKPLGELQKKGFDKPNQPTETNIIPTVAEIKPNESTSAIRNQQVPAKAVGGINPERVPDVATGRGTNPQQRVASANPANVATTQPDTVEKPKPDQPAVSEPTRLRAPRENVEADGRVPTERNASDRREGTSGEGSTDVRTGTGRELEPASLSPAHPSVGNYHINDPKDLVGGSPKARFDKNIKAIETFNKIREEGRQATKEEQDILAAYTGWGSFGQELFQGTWKRPKPKEGWEEQDKWLRNHLDKAEWESLQRSITTAFYTEPPIVDAVWKIITNAGFKGGRVSDPAMGTGNFFGRMPIEIKSRSQLAGIELDSLTGGIAKLLYPDANIHIMGYQDSKTPDNFYDVAIGNIPFENTAIADRRYNRLNPMLHDYFFLKAVDQLRPGGLLAFITSTGTLDKKNPSIRQELAKKAEFVGALRLPAGAFNDYAGTQVETDLIILKKRAEPITDISKERWIKSVEIELGQHNRGAMINEYYANSSARQEIIGTLGYKTDRFGKGVTYVEPFSDTVAALDRAVKLFGQDWFMTSNDPARFSYITNTTADREGSLTKTDKGLFIIRGEYLAPAEEVAKYSLKDARATAKRTAQLESLIDMRRLYGDLIDAERKGLGSVEKDRAALQQAYQNYIKEHGALSDSFGLNYLKKIDDPFYPSLASLESKTEQGYRPAQILTASTMRGKPALANPTIGDAFVLARNKSVNPTAQEIADLAGKPVDQVKQALIQSGAVFETITGDIEPADMYLSGNVREKYRQAIAAVEAGKMELQRNVDALAKVIPPDIPYFNIEVQFGATWVPVQAYKDYIAHMLGRNTSNGIEVGFVAGRWKATLPKGYNHLPEARTGFGTSQEKFSRVLNAALSNQTITIKYTDPVDKTTHVDTEATKEVNERIAKIRSEFGDWLWSDPERRVAVETEYNESRNAYSDPVFDGSFLSFEGMALSLGSGPFNLRQHQVNAIWRAIVKRKSINAHEVGTGKTFTMGGIAVESRRYGIAKKPLILAHNANSKSVAAEINMMYPSAKVLYIDNLSPDTVQTKLRQIANDDWDAVVLPHSLIDKLALKEDTLMAMAQDEINLLEIEAEEAANEDGVEWKAEMLDDEDELKKLRSSTAKDLVKQRNRIIETIKKQSQRASKEGAIAFEDLGVDMILVDEAHIFKKPPIVTRMRMKGLNTESSSRSIALQFLTKYIRQHNNGGNVHTFTGTPVTNTLTEVYHQMRYTMAEEMEAAGVDQWDGWFGSFAKEVEDVELNAAGQYESVVRLAGFINVPELRRMVGQYMDTVFADDMPEMQPRRTKSGKTLNDSTITEQEKIEILNGRTENAKDRPYKKVIVDTADLTPRQLDEFKKIQAYADKWRTMGSKARREAMLNGSYESPIIYEGMATKASFDVRLIEGEQFAGQEGNVPDEPSSKASRVVKNLLEIYQSSPLATQVVFTQLGLGKTATRKGATVKVFSTSQDIVERLVQHGIPREQIAIVDGSTSKDKRKAIADAMNTAAIRIVIGSTESLGVGVNMQRNLRAMHHLDAPWMPGDLEQRNGRGHRQGNQWNTVLEYRYITDRIDGRRWQVLAIKQRFINSFLKSKGDVRVIEGDAASDEESDILSTFAEAAGDPRILIREKLKKKVDQLLDKERLHGRGIAQAKTSIKTMQSRIDAEVSRSDRIKKGDVLGKINRLVEQYLTGKNFKVEVLGKIYTDRAEATAAIDAYITDNLRLGDDYRVIGKVGDIEVGIEYPQYASNAKLSMTIGREKFEGKTFTSLAANLREFEYTLQKQRQVITDLQASKARAELVAQEPFKRAEDLTKAKKALSDLEQDLAVNPIPPPAWLRNGAPVETEVFFKGKPFVVTGHRWNNDGYFVIAEDDKGSIAIPYLEVIDNQGMPLYQEHELINPEVHEKTTGSNKQDESIRFSRTGSAVGSAKNAVVDEKETRAFVERFRRRFSGIDIQVVDNFYGLPLGILEAAQQQAFDPSEIRGVYHDGVAYLVRENHRSVAEVEATLFHEIYAHGGFRKLFGENLSKKFNHLFLALGGTQKIIERGAQHGHNLQVYWDSFEQAGYSNEEKRAALVDELFAHLSQDQANASFSQRALQLAKEFYGAIRQWLREHGFTRLSETADADIAYLLKQAREALGKPTTPNNKGKPQFLRTPMFSRQARESGFSASRDADLWSELKAQAPKEGAARGKELLGKGWQWTKDHIQEVVKTGGLGLLTLRQLAEIGRDVVPAMQKYMALTERMLTARNQMADASGKLAQRWTKLDKATRQRLALVMHKATLERVDPSLNQVPAPEIIIRVADLEWREKLGLARPASLLTEIEPERLAVNDQVLKLLRKRYIEANNKALRSRGDRERFEQLLQVADSLLGDWKAAKAAVQQYERALPVFERLQKQFRALSPEAQAIYTESRDMYEARFARKHKALIESINRSVMPDEKKKALARTLQQEFESVKLQGVYFPLHRQGAYFVRGDVKKAQVSETIYFKKAGFERINRGTGEVTQEADTWDSEEAAMRSANSRSDLIGKDLIAVEQDGGWVLKENPNEPVFLMFPTAAEAEREAARLQADSRYGGVRMGKLNKQNTQDELGRAGVLMQTMTAMKANNQDVPDEMYQLMLEMLPELSMRKNSIHRKGVQGFSADALNAFGHQMLHQAHQISKLEARDQLAQALSDIEEQAKLVPNEQSLFAGQLREVMKKRHDWVMSPRHAPWTNWTSSFGFFMYLGLSPAAALVNLSQVAVLGYPALAAKYGWVEAAKVLNATARQLNLREVVLGDDAIARGVLSDDERAAMEQWHDMGAIDKTQAQLLAGIADNDALSNSPTYQRSMGMVAHLFHKAEVVNREVMLLSAYRLARAKGEAHEQAVQYASDVTWETQFDYSSVNSAGFMHNDFAKVALMFKSYSQHMVYFLLRNARQWGKGGADAKAARSKLLGVLAVTLAMGGVSALPLGFVGAATGFAYAQAKFGTKVASIGAVGAVAGLMLLSAAVLDDEEDWESELRKVLRNMGGEALETLVFRGAVNLTTGVDLSSRINLDDLILRESDRDLEGADAKGALLEQLAGPVVGYGVNALYTVPELWSQDHEWRAVEKLMPKFARDWMQTARFGTEGALTMKGSPIVERDFLGLPYSDELNVWNLFWKANGFNAEKLTGQYVANNDFMNAKKRVQASREKVLNRLFVASVENDQKAILEAKKAIKDWNQAHPQAKQINEAAMKRSLAARLRARRENDQGVRVQAAEVYLRE